MKKLPKRIVKTKPEFKKLPKNPKLGPSIREVTMTLSNDKPANPREEYLTVSEQDIISQLECGKTTIGSAPKNGSEGDWWLIPSVVIAIVLFSIAIA